MSVRRYGSERDWRSDHSSSLPTGSVRSEQDGFGRNSDGPSSYRYKPYGSVNNPLPAPARTRSREEFEENRHVSAINWSVCPVLTDTGRFYEMGSGQQREFDMQYKEESSSSHLEKLSQFCESLSRGKSTLSSKFQWHNLLEAAEESSNANGNRNMDIPGSGLVTQVPISMGSNVGPVKYFGGCCVGPTTVGSGNHEAVIDGGSVISMVKPIFGEGRDRVFLPREDKGFRLRARTSIVDSHVDMIEGNDARFADVRKANAGSSVVTIPIESPREKVREKSSKVDMIQGNGDMVRVRDGVRARTSIVDSIVDLIDGSVGDLGKANVGSTVVSMPVESPRETTSRFVRERSSDACMILVKDGVRARTSIVDSIVDIIEGSDYDVGKANVGSTVVTMPVESPRENTRKFLRERSSNVDMIQGNEDMVRVRDGVRARASIVDSIVDVIDESVGDLGKTNVGSTVVTMPVESPRERTRRFVRERSSHVDMIEGNMVRVRDDVREYRVLHNHGCVDAKERVYLVEHQYYGEDGDGLDCRSDHLKYQREVALDHVNLKVVEDSGFERECSGLGGIGAYEDSFSRLPVSYDELYANEISPQRLSAAKNQGIPEKSEMVLKRKRSIDLEMSDRECKKHAMYEINGLSYGDAKWTNQHVEQFSSSETLELRHSKSEGVEDMIDGSAYSSNPLSSPALKQMHSAKPVMPSRTALTQDFLPKGNVKQRLGFCKNVQANLGSAKKVKHRLELFGSATKSLTPNRSVKQRLELAETATKSLTPTRSVKQRLELAETATKSLMPTRSVKQRLELAETATKSLMHTRSVKQRLGHATDAGNSLKPDQNVNHKKLPWIKRLEVRSKVADLDETLNSQVVESSQTKKNKKNLEAKPPEDSDEFMHQVQKSFLKFVKLLNENSAQRCKYVEPKGDSALKCGVCGSDSKEFVDTLSLVQHASACKNGLRTEHLGLHKALCVLMGWKNMVDPDRMWVCELLPLTEALSQKEDLIIWPPVVIIHNSSISSNNPDEQIVVGVEDLRDLIRAMGFSQGMTNLCRGKAANLSIMVVNFNGTLSGLREAARLHKRFSVSKHGRVEFQQISGRSGQTGIPAEGPESILYGYLGTAWDLDKLDFATKKRSVVKSKKAIKAVADASFGAQ